MGHAQQAAAKRREDLPEIPVFDVGPAFATETARLAGRERAYAMLDAATAGVPMFGLRLADAISRRWLSAQQSAYLPELDQLASLSGRPGAYFLNVHYEWGCTTAAKPGMGEGTGARLLRALDWNVDGLGRHIVAARIASAFGPWVSLTWPGFTGVLQAMAPGRFAAAINQPTIRKRTGIPAIDWLLSKRDVLALAPRAADPSAAACIRRGARLRCGSSPAGGDADLHPCDLHPRRCAGERGLHY